ncbi:hypothetical protein 2200_scaffold2352_00040 [Bacteriophage sp.]|nr:hypothetical protein 2200_scaffold2352_00040 [Bacteriophage sp.]
MRVAVQYHFINLFLDMKNIIAVMFLFFLLYLFHFCNRLTVMYLL